MMRYMAAVNTVKAVVRLDQTIPCVYAIGGPYSFNAFLDYAGPDAARLLEPSILRTVLRVLHYGPSTYLGGDAGVEERDDDT